MSYIYLSSTPTTWNFTSATRTIFTNNLTTQQITSDWTNNGSGKFTYTGKPDLFYMYGKIQQDSSTISFNCKLRVYRNNINDNVLANFTSSGAGYDETTTGPIMVNTNDYFQVYISQTSSNTGTSTNLTFWISFTNMTKDMYQSYTYFNYGPATWNFTASASTLFTNSLTTQQIMSEWTNNGSGNFTYTGPPRVFYLYGEVSQSSSTNFFSGTVYIKRNNKYSYTVTSFSGAGSGSVSGETTTYPLIVNTNDSFQVSIGQTQAYTGSSSNFTFYISFTVA